MRKIRLKPTESYCQKYLYTKIMTSKCKIIKYKLNANIFFQIYFCSTFSVRIQKVKINWKGRRLFERRHSKNTIWCESTQQILWIQLQKLIHKGLNQCGQQQNFGEEFMDNKLKMDYRIIWMSSVIGIIMKSLLIIFGRIYIDKVY